MPKYYIANLSKDDVEDEYYIPPEDTVLISITDNCCEAKIANEEGWKHIFRFQFEDLEKEQVLHLIKAGEELPIWARFISTIQAKQIAEILINNVNKSNIIVHCHAGVSRSGAVTQVGLDIGYGLFNFSNLRTVNNTVYSEIKKHIPLRHMLLGKIKQYI